MADRDQIEYAVALRECGFEPSSVERGVRIVEREIREGAYRGFRQVLMSLQISGARPVFREHHIEPVIRRMEAQEAAVQLAGHFAQSAARTAAARADESARRESTEETLLAQSSRASALLHEMTDDEFVGRVPLRPHITEAMQQLTDLAG